MPVEDADQPGKIIIGCDHAAYGLKEKIKEVLTAGGYRVADVGTFSENSVDYPDFGRQVASTVSRGDFERGILICGTGIGMSMVANKYKHIRAALCNEPFSASLSRSYTVSSGRRESFAREMFPIIAVRRLLKS